MQSSRLLKTPSTMSSRAERGICFFYLFNRKQPAAAGFAVFQQPARKVVLLLFALLGASYLFAQSEAPPDEVTENALQFTEIYSVVERNYMDRLDADRTVLNGAVRGMLSTLDPFSAFFARAHFELLQQQSPGQAL